MTTNAENIVQSFGDLAATLGDQYLVTFEAPGELPAVAQVAFQTGDQEYTTVVTLPDASQAQAAPTEPSDGPPARGIRWLVALLVAGLALTVLGVLLRRARHLRPADERRASHRDGQPTDRRSAAGQGCRREAPRPQPADKAAPSAPAASPSDDPTPNDPPRRPSTSPAQPRPARKSLSAAVDGRRLARLTLDSQPELRPEPAEQRGQADNNQTEDPPGDLRRPPADGHSTASGSEAGTRAEGGRPETPPKAAKPAARIALKPARVADVAPQPVGVSLAAPMRAMPSPRSTA